MYELSFMAAAIALFAWVALSGRSLAKGVFGLFVVALAVYAVSVVLSPATVQAKMGSMFRDLMLLSAIGVVAQVVARNRAQSIVGGIVLVLLMMAYQKWFLSTSLQAPQALLPAAADGLAAEGLAAEGELLVELREGYDLAALQPLLAQYGLTTFVAFEMADPDATELDNYIVVDVPTGQLAHLERIKAQLQATDGVLWMEGNETITVAPLPGSAPQRKGNPYGLNDPEVARLWGFEAMEIDKLYALLDKADIKPERKARVAIIDTGVDAAHEDLAANYVSVNTRHDSDPQGHGTHCAGIAAAVSNNGTGIASFSRDNRYVEVTSVRVLNASGMGTQQGIINGMLEAADKGADVLSMSLGGRSTDASQRAYKKAVAYAIKKGAIVVAAAGNSNRNAKDFAPVNTPGIIGVSAVDSELNRAVFSNYVQDIPMAVAAPGVDVYSTKPNNNYAAHNGTSMATPYVAGLVGLLKSLRPSLTAEQAYQLLHKTGADTKNTKETGRFIQPYAAVKTLLGM